LGSDQDGFLQKKDGYRRGFEKKSRGILHFGADVEQMFGDQRINRGLKKEY